MTLRWVDFDGIRFACETRGDGPWLVLLHGLGGERAQAFDLAGHVEWCRLAVDLRAHGETEPVGPAAAFSFSQFAADVVAILDDLHIAEAVVAGVSMGAGVTLRLALDYPSRIRGLVVARPAWLDEPHPENLAAFPEIAGLLRGLGPVRGLAAFRASATYARIEAASKAAAAALCSQFSSPKAVERAIRLERMPGSLPFQDRAALSGVRVPSLVIGCHRDPVHPMSFAEVLADALGHSSLVVVTSKADDEAVHAAEVRTELAIFLGRLRSN